MTSMYRSHSSPASLPTAGTAPQKEDLAMDEIANAVYDPAISDVMNGWRRVQDRDLDQFGTKPSQLERGSGLRAGVFTNGQDKAVVAFAGTDPSSLGDLRTDVAQELGIATDQYRQARKLVGDVVAQRGAANVMVVGHSLGGGLAAAAALENNCNAVVFNAAGLHDNSLSDPSRQRARAAQGAVRHYHVDREALQQVNRISPFSSGVPGVVIELQSRYGKPDPDRSMASLQMHSMDRVVSAMRTDPRFQGPRDLESARFANAALPPWGGQDAGHTRALQQIRGRDAERARSHQGFDERAEATRQHVRDTRHANADISHGRPVDFGIVDQGHREHLKGRQEGHTPAPAPRGDSELAAVLRQTASMHSSSTSIAPTATPSSRFRPAKDQGNERGR